MPGQRAFVLALAFASTTWGTARAEALHDMDDGVDERVQQIDDDLHEGLLSEQIEGIEHGGGGHQPLSTEQMHGIHKKMDANGDGKVSMAEVLAFSDSTRRQIAEREVETVLEEMDLDKDGKLSVQELVKDWLST